MKQNFLIELRTQLAEIRATTHDTVEPSTIQELDKAIYAIDKLLLEDRNDDSEVKRKALVILDGVFRYLPSIIMIISKYLP